MPRGGLGTSRGRLVSGTGWGRSGRGWGLFRFLTIGWVLLRHDLLAPLIAYRLLPVWLALGLTPLVWVRDPRWRTQSLGARIVAAATALGPSFIKLGQAMSCRPDIVGKAVAEDLASLQDALPPFAAATARAIIEAELERPIDALFTRFDDQPVAAASIAQVHKAMTSEGRAVAVKVLRPDIDTLFARDIDLFRTLALAVERVAPQFRRLKPRAVVETFARSIELELDLRFEAAAAAELAENFADDPGFRVPAIDWSRTGRRVLVLDWVNGLRVGDRAGLDRAGIDRRHLVTLASGAFFHQVFRDGFFHADMHPGNLFVDPTNAGLVAIDFGIMGRIEPAIRYYLADMLLGFLAGDYRRVAEIHFAAGFVPADQSLEEFTQAIRSIGTPLMDKPLAEISVGRLLAQLFEVTEQFKMETQPKLLLLQKTMVTAEGVGRMLDPTVNMWEMARPLIEAWMIEHRGLAARTRQAAERMVQTLEKLPALAASGERLVRQAESGGLRLHPDTVSQLADALDRRRRRGWLGWAVAVLALALLLGH